jgi:hypothetical protein
MKGLAPEKDTGNLLDGRNGNMNGPGARKKI